MTILIFVLIFGNTTTSQVVNFDDYAACRSAWGRLQQDARGKPEAVLIGGCFMARTGE